jgi:uncharacterized protein (DUF1697 family)
MKRPPSTLPSAGSATFEPYVTLLRGINVGGKNRVPMADLVALVQAAGGRDVTTYIQSGNAVFHATAAVASRMPSLLEKALADRLGLTVPVVVRSADALRAVSAGNPFLSEGADPALLHVAFLAAKPDAAQAASLDPDRSPPDRVVVHGSEAYLHLPNGVGKTRYTSAYLDARLGTVGTLRNWRTVLALVDLCGG